MFTKAMIGVAMLAMTAEARRKPRAWRGGEDEDGNFIVDQKAVYAYIPSQTMELDDGTTSTTEEFFMGIFSVEGVPQDEIIVWGDSLKSITDKDGQE